MYTQLSIARIAQFPLNWSKNDMECLLRLHWLLSTQLTYEVQNIEYMDIHMKNKETRARELLHLCPIIRKPMTISIDKAFPAYERRSDSIISIVTHYSLSNYLKSLIYNIWLALSLWLRSRSWHSVELICSRILLIWRLIRHISHIHIIRYCRYNRWLSNSSPPPLFATAAVPLVISVRRRGSPARGPLSFRSFSSEWMCVLRSCNSRTRTESDGESAFGSTLTLGWWHCIIIISWYTDHSRRHLRHRIVK